MKKLLLISALALLSFTNKTTEKGTSIGDENIPSVKIKDINGKDVDIAELSKTGKITIFSFWATWCSPCKQELESINQNYEEWQKKYNVQLVAVSIDDARNSMKVKPYVTGKKWPYTVLLDVNQDVKRTLNIPNVPFTILVDKTGKVVYKHEGYTEGDEQVLESKLASLSK